MDYNANALAQAERPSPVLGQLKYASERTAIATQRINQFVERFHGSTSTPVANGEAAGPSTTQTYRNDIDTLFSALDRLDASVCALDTIG